MRAVCVYNIGVERIRFSSGWNERVLRTTKTAVERLIQSVRHECYEHEYRAVNTNCAVRNVKIVEILGCHLPVWNRWTHGVQYYTLWCQVFGNCWILLFNLMIYIHSRREAPLRVGLLDLRWDSAWYLCGVVNIFFGIESNLSGSFPLFCLCYIVI